MENKKEQEPRDLFEEWFKTRPESKLPELFSIISIEGKDLDVIFKETFEAGVQIGLEEFVKELETKESQEAIQKKIQPYFQALADKIFRDLYDKMKRGSHQYHIEIKDYQILKKKYGVKDDNKQ